MLLYLYFFICLHYFHFSFLLLFLVLFDYLIRYFIALCFLTLCMIIFNCCFLFWLPYMITAWLDIFAVLCFIILYYYMHFAWLIISFLAFGFCFNVFVDNLYILINLFWSMFVLLYFLKPVQYLFLFTKGLIQRKNQTHLHKEHFIFSFFSWVTKRKKYWIYTFI